MTTGRILLIVSLLTACSLITYTDNPYKYVNIRPFTPPKSYQHTYTQMSICAGRKMPPFDLITWRTADIIFNEENNAQAAATADKTTNTITIRSDYTDNQDVVGHEILHLMLPRGKHGIGLFERCDPV